MDKKTRGDAYFLLSQLQKPDFWRKQGERFFFFQKFIVGNHDANYSLHLPMCDFVQEPPPWERKKRHGTLKREKLVLIPRGHLKSSVITIAYPLWRIVYWDYFRRPLRILIAGGSLELTVENFLGEIRRHLTMNDLLKALWPEVVENIRKETFKQKYLRVPVGRYYFSIEAASYNQGLSGKHYDLMILDDLVNEKNFNSEAEMRRIKTWFRNTYSLGENDSELIVVGTRYSYNDLYEMILDEDGYSQFETFIRKVWVTDENGDIVYDKDGNPIPIFPEKFTLEDIRQKQEAQKLFFSAQYLNEPVSVEYASIKPEYIQYYRQLPEGRRFAYYIAVDPARTTSKTSDYSAIVVGAMDEDGNIYVERAIQGRWTLSELIKRIINLAKLYQPYAVGIETENFEVLEQIIREKTQKEKVYFPFRKLKSGGRNKYSRMAAVLTPWFEERKVFLKPNQHELIDQLLRFSPLAPLKHDDLLDALTYLIELARPPLMSDEEQQRKDILSPVARFMLDIKKRWGENKRDDIFDWI